MHFTLVKSWNYIIFQSNNFHSSNNFDYIFSPIVYQRFQGRLGNQLNGYSMMLQLKKQYGYQPYLSNQTYNILNQMFVSETIELPVLEETFCNIEEMPFKV